MQVITLLQDIYNLSVNIKLEIERTKIIQTSTRIHCCLSYTIWEFLLTR